VGTGKVACPLFFLTLQLANYLCLRGHVAATRKRVLGLIRVLSDPFVERVGVYAQVCGNLVYAVVTVGDQLDSLDFKLAVEASSS